MRLRKFVIIETLFHGNCMCMRSFVFLMSTREIMRAYKLVATSKSRIFGHTLSNINLSTYARIQQMPQNQALVIHWLSMCHKTTSISLQY